MHSRSERDSVHLNRHALIVHAYFTIDLVAFVSVTSERCKEIILDGTRTRSLRLRRPTPYPLGHEDCMQCNMTDVLLQNVERGSQMMTKLRATRGHSHPASTARSSKSMPDERDAFNSGVFGTRLPRKTVPNIASRSTSAHYRCHAFKCGTWLVIRSGRQIIQFKKLVIVEYFL